MWLRFEKRGRESFEGRELGYRRFKEEEERLLSRVSGLGLGCGGGGQGSGEVTRSW